MIVLLWLVLPFKMIKNFIKTEIQLFKIKPEQMKDTLGGSKFDYKAALSHMDIWRTPTFISYVTRTDNNELDGKNHKTSNMTALNAFYLFLLGQTVEGKEFFDKEPTAKGIMLPMHTTGHLSNGFKYNIHGAIEHNIKSTNASTLANLNLAMHTETSDMVQDRFDVFVQEVINNDFGLLEFEEPDDEVAKDAWLEQPIGRKKLKSVNAMFQPDPSLTGEKALIILASLKLAEVQRKSLDAKEAYYKLLWKNGYAFLSAFPTAEVSESAMFSLYVLSKRSTGKEKILWKFAMRRLQALAVNTDHDMLFTGMLFDAYPELLEKDENKMRLLYFNRKLNIVDSKYNNLNYLGNYTMIKKVIDIMLIK